MSDMQESPKKTARYIAFDLGAESSRAIVGAFTQDRLEIEELHRFPSRNIVVRGTRQWDILYFYGEMLEALRRYSAKYGHDLAGIGVDTWGVDFGVLGASGQLLANPVHYRDHRTDGILDEAFHVVPRQSIYAQTGIQFMPLNSLFQCWAMLKETPELLREAGTLLLMPDLFNYFFTGFRASEYTIASTTQMLDVHQRQWCRPLLEAFSLPLDIMPEIIPPCTVVGPLDPDIARDVGLHTTEVIAPCCHDTGSAVAAIPAEGGDWAYISCGTWSLMGAELSEPITSDKALEYNFTNEGGIGNTIRFLKNIMGLWVLQQCRAAWTRRGEEHSYATLTDMAHSEAPFQVIIDVDDPSFLNPEDMLEAIAAHCSATGQHPPESIGATVRAVLEGLAIRYAVCLENLEDVTGKRVERIHMAGGGIQNELLCQFASNATGRPVVAGPIEATAIGNLIAQAMATGRLADHAEARRLIARSTAPKAYEPADTDKWRAVIERFKKGL